MEWIDELIVRAEQKQYVNLSKENLMDLISNPCKNENMEARNNLNIAKHFNVNIHSRCKLAKFKSLLVKNIKKVEN